MRGNRRWLKGLLKAERKTVVRAGESVGSAGRSSKGISFSLFSFAVYSICILLLV